MELTQTMAFTLWSIQGLLCCLAYFLAGIVDSVSGGGGLITIPALLATGVPVHYITGTNQCAAWIGSGAAAYQYMKNGGVHLRSAVFTLPFAVLGSYLGARLNLLVPEQALKMFMLVTVPVLAVFILANRRIGEDNRIAEKSPVQVALRSAVIGLVLGGYQGFYGPGSGLFFILAYAALLKLDLVRAAGNTRFVIAVCSVTSVLTYALSGAVLWDLSVAAAVFYTAGSYLGASLAIRKGARIIRPMMILVIALLLVKLAVDFL